MAKKYQNGNIGSIRDNMTLESAYIVEGRHDIELRIYATRRGGVYGYQFAAILWDNALAATSPVVGHRTTGCGYSKDAAAAAEVLGAAALIAGKSETPYGEVYRLAESGLIAEALALYSGMDRDAVRVVHG